MECYYYNHLSFIEQRFYQHVLKSLKKRSSSISSDILLQDKSFDKVLRAIAFDRPELYYVNFQALSYMQTPFGVTYNPNFIFQASVLDAMNSQIESVISAVLQSARDSGITTAYGYLRWIHNYLVKNVKYNYEALKNPGLYPEAYTCFGALVSKLAVCEGISKAFKLLCDRAGLDVFIVAGESSPENSSQMMPHAWNCAKIDNHTTYIDVTWDINLSNTSKAYRYDYFCIPDSAISSDHIYTGYPACSGFDLSYFVQTGKLFSGAKQLQEYLEHELRRNGKTLYFRVSSSASPSPDFHQKIQSNVEKAITQFGTSIQGYQTAHNLKQNIFYYKIL